MVLLIPLESELVGQFKYLIQVVVQRETRVNEFQIDQAKTRIPLTLNSDWVVVARVFVEVFVLVCQLQLARNELVPQLVVAAPPINLLRAEQYQSAVQRALHLDQLPRILNAHLYTYHNPE